MKKMYMDSLTSRQVGMVPYSLSEGLHIDFLPDITVGEERRATLQ